MSIGQVEATASSLPEVVDLGSNSELDKMAFLKLLTVQLSNQDPLNPVDSDQMAQQQAMFAQVEQLMNLNGTMESFVTSQEEMMAGLASAFNTLESTSYLGKDVQFYTNQVVVGENGMIGSLRYDLTEDATVGYTITDESGKTIFTKGAESVSAGEGYEISWDSTDTNGNAVPAGTYTVKLDVQDSSGTALRGNTYGEVLVRSIDFRYGTPVLTLEDGRQVSVTQVMALTDRDA